VTDILQFMLPNQVWALSNHLEIPGGQPIYTSVIGNQIWYVKNKQGFPWDMNTFDDDFVYQSITEVNWQEPKQFKIFASKSWPKANGAIVWTPRDYEKNAWDMVSESTYRAYSDCSNFTTKNLGGPVITVTETPKQIDLGGDLGKQFSLQMHYYWGAAVENLEINTYALGFGWAQWELWSWNGTRYVQKQVSAFNHIAPGGNVHPVFPCGVPVIT
jgi:hypothetical protein